MSDGPKLTEADAERLAALPDMDDILRGRVTTIPEGADLSLLYALAALLAATLKGRVEARDWQAQADRALDFVRENYPAELAVLFYQTATRVHRLPFEGEAHQRFRVAFKDLIPQ